MAFPTAIGNIEPMGWGAEQCHWLGIVGAVAVDAFGCLFGVSLYVSGERPQAVDAEPIGVGLFLVAGTAVGPLQRF